MTERALVLLFSGQGAQVVGMGKSLCENDVSAAGLFERAEGILGFPLRKICFEGPDEQLKETKVCQPALYVVGYAIFDLLQRSGHCFQASLGLSLGELTALAAAGVFDFETGLRIVAKRGELMQRACEQTRGGMLCLLGGAAENVQVLCGECDLDVANINCPGQIVVAGEMSKLPSATETAKKIGFNVIPLNVAGAYHSRLMRPACAEFEAFLAKIPFNAPRWTVFTNTTGQAISDPQSIKDSLVKQITSTVHWESCIKNVLQSIPSALFIECGPKKTLAGLVKKIDKSASITPLCEYSAFIDFNETEKGLE